MKHLLVLAGLLGSILISVFCFGCAHKQPKPEQQVVILKRSFQTSGDNLEDLDRALREAERSFDKAEKIK